MTIRSARSVCSYLWIWGTDKHTYQQTAIDLNVLYPLATALHIAILSAHKVRPYEAFSTLHPVR